nr:thioredoxin family protein [Granulosicoccus sp.]
ILLHMSLGQAAEIGDDGLHKADWMQETFKDLSEDLTEAHDSDKRLLLIFEQRGCIYCAKMHEEVFSDPEVSGYIDEHFFVVQLNLHGSEEVTDFDGKTLEEREMARKWGIMFTPTMMFMPASVESKQSASELAVATVPGAFGKGTVLDVLSWVYERRYLTENEEDFQRYHARRIQERADGSTD